MPKTVHRAQERAEQNRYQSTPNQTNQQPSAASNKAHKKTTKRKKPQVVKHAQKPLPKIKKDGEFSEEEIINIR